MAVRAMCMGVWGPPGLPMVSYKIWSWGGWCILFNVLTSRVSCSFMRVAKYVRPGRAIDKIVLWYFVLYPFCVGVVGTVGQLDLGWLDESV